MISFEEFTENCRIVRERVAEACAACGRDPESVKILPVTKNHPVEAPVFAAQAGFSAVGENRVQEAENKKQQFREIAAGDSVPAPRWELIGHLQSNKARRAVEIFDRIQSVDSVSLLQKINRLCGEIARERLPILLQANPGCDPAKFGTADYDGLRLLAEAAFKSENLQVDGLMCVAPIDDDSLETARRSFETLREWRERLEKEFGKKLPELSMGMSHDLAPAVAAGSTMVRIGTALFGARDYKVPNS
ncbi:MAG: YggS family pyridoxal phosphate-dependent enzyme [Opitutales bacterium]|nr:YggS family pyridoxal phosphate-dependent enzyme [Opitutales bacterium]